VQRTRVEVESRELLHLTCRPSTPLVMNAMQWDGMDYDGME
jgi:hypothetical protein